MRPAIPLMLENRPELQAKPMLNTLQSHDMTCVAAVVTRQFGGVKLGIRGLIEAYAQSVETAIDLTPLIRLVKTILFQV